LFYIVIKRSFAPSEILYLNTKGKPHSVLSAFFDTEEEAIEAAASAGLDEQQYDEKLGNYTIEWNIVQRMHGWKPCTADVSIPAKTERGSSMDSVELHNTKQNLGLMVMIERKQAGLTQKQCAENFGISQSNWSVAERGRGNISIARLLEMIANLNLAALPEAVNLANSNRPTDPHWF